MDLTVHFPPPIAQSKGGDNSVIVPVIGPSNPLTMTNAVLVQHTAILEPSFKSFEPQSNA